MKKLTYENAIKRLEEIVCVLEDGNIELEQSMKLFEEGTKLLAYCNEYLTNAEQKVIQLSLDSSKDEDDIDE